MPLKANKLPSFLFIWLSLGFQSLSVIFGKSAALSLGEFNISNIIHSFLYIISMLCLGLQAITWQIALRKFPLFYAYFFMSAIYPLLLVFSYFFFDEKITLMNIIGSIVIVTGTIILMSGRKDAEDA